MSYEHRGQSYRGSWYVEGNLVEITSAYGARSEALGRDKGSPETIAKTAMAMIVMDYLKNERARPTPPTNDQ